MQAARTITVALFALILVPIGAVPASAATFKVTKKADTNDGFCNAHCSLREAVVAANATPERDVIVLPQGRFTLSRNGTDDTAALGDLDLSEPVTVRGAGWGRTIVDADGMDRVFDVVGSPKVTLTGLRVVGGSSDDGGGIRNAGTLRLVNVLVRGSEATGGGGGIHSDGAAVVVRGSRIAGNTAGTYGGGIRISSGSLTLVDSRVTGNQAPGNDGGGMLLGDDVPLTATRTVIAGNTAGSDGGGIYGARLTIVDSTIRGNTAAAKGGGIEVFGPSSITGSTISGNHADSGGGIRQTSGVIPPDLIVDRSTVSGNTADGHGGGIEVSGTTPMLTIEATTITGNRADHDSAGDPGNGGGIAQSGSATVEIERSILAGNQDGSLAVGEPEECSGSVTSLGYNVVGHDEGCGYADDPTDLVGEFFGSGEIAPGVRPLADNGGRAATHALLKGSPARNLIPGGHAACGGKDQRGVPRPQQGGCDAGSYEYVTCLGVVVNRVGTKGSDTLIGTTERDGVLAFAGADLIVTKGGGDGVCAGAGDDTVRLGSENDRVRGQGGNDNLLGQAGNDALDGGAGRRDRCRQGPGSGPLRRCEI